MVVIASRGLNRRAADNERLAGQDVLTGIPNRRLFTRRLEKLLAGRQYAMGDKFSVADAYLYTVLNWTGMHKIDLGKWPNIKGFMARVAARPAVQETLKAEGLIK